jgi:shikimate kinase
MPEPPPPERRPAEAVQSMAQTLAQIARPRVPAMVRRIVLTGFMGAGKTTVGNLLATRLAWGFVDADERIEAAAGATIARLFIDRGEPWFRQFEHETIRQLLNAPSLVLALGGGAIEDERTLNLLLSSKGTQLVHLEASLETVLERCRGTESLRPVLQDKPNLEARYARRLPLYRQAHLTLAVDALSPQAAADAILDHLGVPVPA